MCLLMVCMLHGCRMLSTSPQLVLCLLGTICLFKTVLKHGKRTTAVAAYVCKDTFAAASVR